MRKYGAFAVPYAGQKRYEQEAGEGHGVEVSPGERRTGFKTPSGRIEVHSSTKLAVLLVNSPFLSAVA